VAAQLNVDHSHLVSLAPPPVLVIALSQTRPVAAVRLAAGSATAPHQRPLRRTPTRYVAA